MEAEINEHEEQQKEKGKAFEGSGHHPSMMNHSSRSSPSHVSLPYENQEPSMACQHKEKAIERMAEEVFDSFIKLKSEDKPKDTLTWIQFKKRQAQKYLSKHFNKDNAKSDFIAEENNIKSNQLFKKIYEVIIRKTLLEGSLLLTRIRHSLSRRCEIIVTSQEGEVVCYFPQVCLIKKNQKILKIAQKYSQNRHLVLDQCFQEWEKKYFAGIYRHCPTMVYYINSKESENIQFIASQLGDYINNGLLQCRYQQDFIKIIPQIPEAQNIASPQYNQSLFKSFKQEQQFLCQFRGQKKQEQLILQIDLLGIDIWRLTGLTGQAIADKIIKLYKMKEQSIIQTTIAPINDPNSIHIPFNMQKQKNCVMCMTVRPTVKPKRTYIICKLCSAQKEKPVYLCKGCFGQYHLNPDLPLFKKNVKKTKKVMQDHHKKFKQIKKQQKEKHQGSQEEAQQKRKALLRKLNRQTNEFFERLEEMVEERQQDEMQACQFYYNMLLNQNIHSLHMLSSGQSAQIEPVLIKQQNTQL